MRSRVGRWGNSLAVRVPGAFARELNLEDGSDLEITLEDGRMVIQPPRRRFALEDLVSGITPENRHSESDWGEAVGGEVW